MGTILIQIGLTDIVFFLISKDNINQSVNISREKGKRHVRNVAIIVGYILCVSKICVRVCHSLEREYIYVLNISHEATAKNPHQTEKSYEYVNKHIPSILDYSNIHTAAL